MSELVQPLKNKEPPSELVCIVAAAAAAAADRTRIIFIASGAPALPQNARSQYDERTREKEKETFYLEIAS